MRRVHSRIEQADARTGRRRGVPRGRDGGIAGGGCPLQRTCATVDMVEVVTSAGVGVAQDAQRLLRRQVLRCLEYHQPKVHRGDDLLAIDRESGGTGAVHRGIRRRQAENFVANDGIAVLIRIHDPPVRANEPADFKPAQLAQLIRSLRLYLTERLRQRLQGKGGQRQGGQPYLGIGRSGRQYHGQYAVLQNPHA
jgi:hypothetical protein